MLIVHLLVSYAHVNLCHFFSSSWCQVLAAASARGSSWTFLFTFLDSPNLPKEVVRHPRDLQVSVATRCFCRVLIFVSS